MGVFSLFSELCLIRNLRRRGTRAMEEECGGSQVCFFLFLCSPPSPTSTLQLPVYSLACFLYISEMRLFLPQWNEARNPQSVGFWEESLPQNPASSTYIQAPSTKHLPNTLYPGDLLFSFCLILIPGCFCEAPAQAEAQWV